MAHPYHEAYWVVIGTAAPVIALAAVVAFNQANIGLERLIRNQPREEAAEKVPIGFWASLFSFMALILCVISQLWAFVLSLLTLATKNEDGNTVVEGGVLAGGGLFLLWFATLFFGIWRLAMTYQAWDHQADDSDDTPDDSDDTPDDS
jgi:amino acid transporter